MGNRDSQNALPVYSVTEVTIRIKNLFENHFTALRLAGEISNCRPSSTGHLYFTLKDSQAAIQAVMFKSKVRSLSFEPKDGMQVIACGALSVYEQRGTYQIIVERMELAGEGELLRMLEQRKQALAAEGLFDPEHKKPLPFFPQRIVVITSPTGAALRDILTVLARRNPKVSVTVLPAPVQGSDAPPLLIQQLENANRYHLGEVIIIGRGGGALEDLLPFSDEQLVRAIYHSDIPVISAVGHEIDYALSDFVADVRAPTPSAAAEIVAPVLEPLVDMLADKQAALQHTLESRIEKIRLMIQSFMPETLEMRFRRIEQPLLMRFDDAKETLLMAMRDKIISTKHALALLTKTIETANPQDILKRGYAIVYDKATGKIITKVQEVTSGQKLRITVSNGSLSVIPE
ncbi:MAG: exodeoxyribonuclease VII large subunit [Treponema sp.]